MCNRNAKDFLQMVCGKSLVMHSGKLLANGAKA